MRFFLVALFGALAGCTGFTGADVAMRHRDTDLLAEPIPAMKQFGALHVPAPSRSNPEIAADFIDLAFRMESGRSLPVLTRFDGPVTVTLRGDVPASAQQDLTRLLQRLRSEAQIDITQTAKAAAVTIEFVPRRKIKAMHANVACFVVPRVSSWSEFRAARGSAKLDWATLTRRDRVAVFVPSDTSAQDVRDCLHEELAQAIGPLNDLYQLPDSVFNDDNFHTILTGFDMLILRLYNAPELGNGMHADQVAALLPGLLARMNPAGQRPGTPVPGHTPRIWIDAMEFALGTSSPSPQRRAAARQALGIARAQGWSDSRLGFSYFAVGRVNLAHDDQAAIAAFAEAARIYRNLPGGQIHAAHVDMQLAAFALSRGNATDAISLADHAIPVVLANENAALLATLMLIKSESLALLGRADEARALRLDSLGWARYGFGSQDVVRDRMRDIAALAPAQTGS
ncbi:MAG: DUF2927 domain-containing protein [Paracoccaceae bacterium]|nr:DUF2927 domain-containing protein [Paracoccaceae bacterium]